MELAATALAQAVGQDDGRESDSSEEEDGGHLNGHTDTHSLTSPQSRLLSVSVRLKTESHKAMKQEDSIPVSSSNVTVDALVGILQDPDRGVPRALETQLKDVKIRRGEQTDI